MYIGRVTGQKVLQTRFRAEFDEKVQVGEMLVVEDSTGDGMYLIRVSDVEHGAEMDGEEWIISTAGSALRFDQEGSGFEPSRHRQRMYSMVSCVPLGHIHDGGFHKTKTIPAHFSMVRRATSEDYQFLEGYMGDLEVGRLRSGDDVLDMAVSISGISIPHHMGIFATTGMGKSNLMKTIALSCMKRRRYGFLVLDPHGEYYDGGEAGKKGLRDARIEGGLEVFSSRRLSGPHNTLRVSANEIEVADLESLYEFSGAQLECLQAAQWRYGNSWLGELHRKEVGTISSELGERFHEGSINVIKRRLENVFRFDLVTTDPKLSVTGTIIDALHSGKVVLVDTSNMFEAEELLVSTVLSRAIFEHHKSMYSDVKAFDSVPPVLIALEEAQRVLSEPKGSIFAQIAREGRKFRVGLCAVSQQPKLIDNEVISQFNTLFILGLSDKNDRDILRNSAKQDIAQLDNEIQMLMPGEALVASPFTPFAIPLRVHLYEDYVLSVEEGRSTQARRDTDFF